MYFLFSIPFVVITTIALVRFIKWLIEGKEFMLLAWFASWVLLWIGICLNSLNK